MLSAIVRNALPNWAFVVPELALHRVIDDDYDGAFRIVPVRKQAALFQGDAQRFEIVGGDRGKGAQGRRLSGFELAAFHLEGKGNGLRTVCNQLRLKWVTIRDRCGHNSWLALHAIKKLLDHARSLFVRIVL